MAKLCHVLPLAHLLGGTCLEGQRGARIEGGAKGIVAPCSGAVRTAESPVPSRAGFDRRYRTEGSTMSAAGSEFRKQFLIEARHSLEKHYRSEEHTSELQSQSNLVCRLLLEKKKDIIDAQDKEIEGRSSKLAVDFRAVCKEYLSNAQSVQAIS